MQVRNALILYKEIIQITPTYLVMLTTSAGISLILLEAILSSVNVFIWQIAVGKLDKLLSARFKLQRLWNLKPDNNHTDIVQVNIFIQVWIYMYKYLF